MRVAIVTTAGVTRQFRQWPEAVLGRALVAKGHVVSAFTLREIGSDITGQRREGVDGIDVRRIDVNKAWLAPGLAVPLASFRPDVIHLFHLRNALNWQAVLLARMLRAPVVFTVVGPFHDPYLVDNRERPYSGKMYPGRLIYSPRKLLQQLVKARGRKPLAIWQNWCMHFPLASADRLIALSRHEVGLLARLGFGSDKVRQVPLWIDVPFIQSVPFGSSLAAAHESPHILFLGQLKERKGYDLLAHAMPRVLAEIPSAKFLFAGQNPAQAGNLIEICQQNNSIGKMVLLGRVGEEDKVRLMRSSDCLVYPTRYESFGLPPLEAMACGCPVIATDLPVVNEMVTDGLNGVLVKPEDPTALAEGIIRVLKDAGLRRTLIAGGYRTLERYSEADLIIRVESIYRDVTQ